MSLAAKLKTSRQNLWRHRKKHLGLDTSKDAPIRKEKPSPLEVQVQELAREGDRLQRLAEAGMPKENFNLALEALRARMRMVELQAKLEGRIRGGKGVPVQDINTVLKQAGKEAAAVVDPVEEARLQKEYDEVCGSESEQ
jgi:hypothetical protein